MAQDLLLSTVQVIPTARLLRGPETGSPLPSAGRHELPDKEQTGKSNGDSRSMPKELLERDQDTKAAVTT